MNIALLKLLAPLTENKEGGKGFMALRVRPARTRFPTNILYASLDNTCLYLYQMCDGRACCPAYCPEVVSYHVDVSA